MPKPAVFEAKYLYDSVRATDAGINDGIDPLLIPRNQLAFARNVTIRGTFPTHRPPYRKIGLSFPSDTVKGAVQQGFFQGAGYYKPDAGTESVILAIGGKLYAVAISGNAGTVSDVSIPGDPQSSSAPQIWMRQAEKWMIVNDSVGLPVFFDGNVSRRSVGAAAVVVGSPVVAGFTPVAQGLTQSLTLTNPFSGPFNVPLRITDPGSTGTPNGIFEAVGTGSFNGYPITVTNLIDTAGTVEASGDQVTIDTSVFGVNKTAQTFSLNSTVTLFLTAPPTLPLNTTVNVPFSTGTKSGRVSLINGSTIQVTFTVGVPVNSTIAVGAKITTNSGGSTLIGLLNQAFTAPAIGASGTAFLDRAYTGSVPQIIYINNQQYQITAVPTPPPSNAVIFLNISAPQTAFGAGAIVSTIAELPAGRMGDYGLGRWWQSLTDGRKFIGGDIVGGSSGTSTYEKRDAVLRVQENNLLAGGGTFLVPGQVGDIRAMIFTSVLDASLGQGPLAVITEDILFSCQAPTDRTTWQNLNNPILTEGMKGGAGTGQDSTIIANSDVLMRSLVGLRSYIQGRRDFDVWGNVPISREVDPILATDDPSLLPFASSAEFDNRMLHTTSPVQSNFGVYWTELIALNFDPISSLRGKAPSVYDGVWDGLNVLKLVKGKFAGVERLFAVCVSSDLTQIELWEILKSTDTAFQDNDGTPIVWEYETAALNFYENDPRKRDFMRLLDGELRIDQMNETLFGLPITVPHTVKFEVFYKPDQWPNWVPWHSWTETFDPGTDPGFRPTEGVGEPSPHDFDETNNNPLREATTFQFKVRITGHCRVVNHRFKSATVPEKDFASPKSS